MVVYAAKELHFNRSGEALKRMQAGVDKLASVVGVTLGPKVCSTIPALLQISDTRQALSKFCTPDNRAHPLAHSQQGILFNSQWPSMDYAPLSSYMLFDSGEAESLCPR